MSLIERAANKLAEAAVPVAAEPSSAPGAAEKRTTVERFVDRLPQLAPVETAAAAPPPAAAPIRVEPPLPLDRESAGGAALRIHLESLRLRGFVTPDGERTQIAQEFRVIKRPLLANAFGRGAAPVRNGKRVMVTSALPDEGKSFCAINLALSIAAERDYKVLLVDADVARPSLARELGVEVDRGWMDYLVGDVTELSSLIHETNVDKLSLLGAGRTNAHATELLASDAMSQLLDRLTVSYPDTLIVFDSPPLLPTTEARVLATHMGQVLMVVEAGGSPRESVEAALGTLSGCEVVGLVLNKSRNAQAGYYGGYGYGYGTAAA